MEPTQSQQVVRHTHNGVDSVPLGKSSILKPLGAPLSALTPASGTLSSGGATSLSNADNATLNNLITRVGELESKLQALGLIS